MNEKYGKQEDSVSKFPCISNHSITYKHFYTVLRNCRINHTAGVSSIDYNNPIMLSTKISNLTMHILRMQFIRSTRNRQGTIPHCIQSLSNTRPVG